MSREIGQMNPIGIGNLVGTALLEIEQGGVSFNEGIVKAFERHIGSKVTVPHYNVLMGALGMSILARDYYNEHSHITSFRGIDVADVVFNTSAFNCEGCPNQCEIIEVRTPEDNNNAIARWGDRCGKWEVF